VEARSAPGPSKNGLQERFWKNMKINEIWIGRWEVFDGLKPLKVWNRHRFHAF
jgi:hypothetical protein